MDKNILIEIQKKQAELALQRTARPLALRQLDISKEITAQEISIITGVRRCGKSMYLSQLKKLYEDTHITTLIEFDDPALDGFEGEDFQKLIEIENAIAADTNKDKPRLLLLDEIQNIKDWQKWLIQLAKDPYLKIVITGSNAKLLSSELGTLLTGRHVSHEMTPLSFVEILQYQYKVSNSSRSKLSDEELLDAYEKYYKYGGFPRSFVERDASILPQYFSDILERDVIARHGARLTRPMREFSRALCADNTRLINLAKMARNLGVKDNATLGRYSSWLEECYLFHEIKQFSPSVKKQIRSHPKFYCVDPSLARYSSFSVMGSQGAFLENTVYLELRRRGYDIHYWQADNRTSEVDFICRLVGSNTIAVQVSLTVEDENTLDREIRGLLAVNKELGIEKLLIITKNDFARKIEISDISIELVRFIDWA